jgi:broad specificity phosphatase PhoE
VSSAALILVRHAQPAIDERRPPPEWRLSEAGRAAAGALAERLAAYAPAAAVASPEPKARDTGEIIAANFGLTVTPDAGFAEHHRRDLPFGAREDFEARMAAFFAAPKEPFFGGESGEAARARFAAALAGHTARPLLVATHGTILTLYLAPILGLAPFVLWKSLRLPEAFVLDCAGKLLERIG